MSKEETEEQLNSAGPHGCSLRNAKIAPRRTRLNRMRPTSWGRYRCPKRERGRGRRR